MARSARKRRGISWELVGIVAIVGVFLVGLLVWSASSRQAAVGDILPPESASVPAGVETGVTEDGRPYMGSSDAPVTFYEFADFQCSHCRDFSQITAESIKSDFIVPGKARLVWVNFPILGPESTEAAKGGFCAAEQGLFWEYHDWVFANQPFTPNSGRYSRSGLQALAEQVEGLDAAAFGTCLGATATAAKVADDNKMANDRSVQNTPSFLVGETLVVGGDVAGLREALDAAVD